MKRLADRGIGRYSRHVDDICVSSEVSLDGKEVAWAVSQIHGMLFEKSLQAKRAKHKVMRSNGPITILKLVGNEKASLPAKERSRVRTLVHQFCKAAESTVDGDAFRLEAELPRVRGQAYKVKRFHPTEGTQLAARVDEAAIATRSALLRRRKEPDNTPTAIPAVVEVHTEPPPWLA